MKLPVKSDQNNLAKSKGIGELETQLSEVYLT